MNEFRHPPTKGIKYCAILLWTESAMFLALALMTVLSESNGNTFREKIMFACFFCALAILALITGKKITEAKKWAWVTAICFFFITLGSPLLPFCALALYFLFKKESVMYFTLTHVPKNRSDQGGVINSESLRSST
jgi:cell division protein FtsW (lipid II flippase)